MVRNPTSAHAYWEISIDRVKEAGGGPGGRKTFLRVIEVPSGYLLAEHEVSPDRGSHSFGLPLPKSDSSYVVELAIMRDYQWFVLARSNVAHPPRSTPRAATAPAFVTRAEQARALAEGLPLRPFGEGLVPPPIGLGLHAGPTAGGERQVGAHLSATSEAQPRGMGSELRLAHRGSEARLARREARQIPFVIAAAPGIPGPVAAALNVLAVAVWSGRHPIDVLAAGNALSSASAEAGISFDPPSRSSTLRGPTSPWPIPAHKIPQDGTQTATRLPTAPTVRLQLLGPTALRSRTARSSLRCSTVLLHDRQRLSLECVTGPSSERRLRRFATAQEPRQLRTRDLRRVPVADVGH